MEISSEIIDFFNDRRTRMGKLDRNVEIFLYYYGFLTADWPIYEELHKAGFDVNNRARAGQIMDLNFNKISDAGGKPFQSLHEVVGILKGSYGLSTTVFVSELSVRGLANPADCNPMGIIRLIRDLGYCDNYDIFGFNLQKMSRAKYSRHEPCLIIDTSGDALIKLKEGLRQAKELSSDFGLVSFSFLHKALGKSYPYGSIITEIIATNGENTIFDDGLGESYFHVGGFKKDGFVATLARIFGIATRVHVNELAEAIRRPIAKRQGRKTAIRLPIPVIKKFIEVSPYLHEDGDYVYFTGETQPLVGIELAASKYLREHGSVNFPEFREYLTSRRFGIDNIKITVYHSSIINVNKANGFGNYQFSLIGQGDWRELASPEEIQDEIGDEDEISEEFDETGSGDDGNMSREEFEQGLDDAKKTGALGEKLVNAFLTQNKDSGVFLDFRWESELHPNAPYDFWLREMNATEAFIDTKSTRGRFELELYISLSELCKMRESGNYVIFRVYELTETTAKLRVSANMSEFATYIMKCAESFPAGVVPNGIVLKPTSIEFGEVVELIL